MNFLAILKTVIFLNRNMRPLLMHERTITNMQPDLMHLTRVFCKTATFDGTKIGADGVGRHCDTGLHELPIRRLLYHGKSTEIGPGLVWLNGRFTPYRVKPRWNPFRSLDGFFTINGFSFEAIPLAG